MLPITLAQINPTVGNIDGNAALVLKTARAAKAQGAQLVVFPELCITGYPPEDLILSPTFRLQCMEAVRRLAADLGEAGPAVIVGSVWEKEGCVHNAALLLDGGSIVHVQPKFMLPNYGIFDEKRVFDAGDAPEPLMWRDMRLGIMVCEDAWFAESYVALHNQVDAVIVINASPYETGKPAERLHRMRGMALHAGAPVLYVNTAGAQDDIVFDGGSFVLNAKGDLVLQLPTFREGTAVCTSQSLSAAPIETAALSGPNYAEMWQASVLGLQDYVEKNRFPGVLLGLSGGIDSAVVAAIAADALGASRVLGVLLPSPFNAPESTEDALTTGKLLSIPTVQVPILPGMDAMESMLTPAFAQVRADVPMMGWMENVAIGGNVQSRLRGLTLMSLSNATGFMLLNTSNKSELAVGYSTLYGDSCGGYAPIKDIYKTEIYAMARWRNKQSRSIPLNSIDKAPSAELAPGQKDQDQLPPYDILDAILYQLVEERVSIAKVVSGGYEETTVRNVAHMLRVSEYKRRQSPPGPKISRMHFGRDRRFPMTNGFKG